MKSAAFKRHTVPLALGLVLLVVFLLHATRVLQFAPVERLELFAYDAQLRFSMPHTKDNRIVIVDIDEKSLAEEGRWPWGRDRMATLIDKLFDKYKVALVAFDVVFAEKDESIKILEQLEKSDPSYRGVVEQLKLRLDHDQAFARALQNRNTVLGYYFNLTEDQVLARQTGVLPAPVFPAGPFQGKAIPFQTANGYGANLPELQKAAASAGHFVPKTEIDGIIRRVPMLVEYDGNYYESLALAVIRLIEGLPKIEAIYPPEGRKFGYKGFEWLKVGDFNIPVDESASALVPYRGKKGSFPYVSATDILRDRANPADLQGAIVLVGTSAPGLQDLRATPVSPVYPGVEVHANLISGMLDQNLRQRPAYVLGGEVALLFILAVVLSFLFPLMSPLKQGIATLIATAVVLLLNFTVWSYGNLVMPLASPLLLILLLFVLNMSYGYFVESRGKRQLAGVFGQYVPPQLVDEMGEDPQRYTNELMEGQSREMTILFTDVRNFTSISEGLSSKQLSEMLNDYLTPMTHIIQKHRGTIDKYIGDAIMAFWGAPVADPEHARHALLAAMEMQETLVEIREKFKQRGWPEFYIGAGVNTGLVSVGNMGSQFRMAYTVLGDPVNLASRLEGLTKQYGASIIVGEATKKAVSEVVFRELDRVRVQGKEETVSIYEPIGLSGKVDKSVMDEMRLFQHALTLYRARDWDMAEMQFLSVQKNNPQHTHFYQIYIERIARFRIQPPAADWDGAYDFETK